MSDLKIQPTKASVTEFINALDNERRKADAKTVLKLMKEVTKEKPKMWGDNIVGFGTYHYKYESGREGDFFKVGFAPRKQRITIYLMSGFKMYKELFRELGKHKKGSACLHINKLEDVEMKVLEKLIRESHKYITEKKWP